MNFDDIKKTHETSLSNLQTAKNLVKGQRPKVEISVKPPGFWVAVAGRDEVARSLETTGSDFVAKLRAWLASKEKR